MQLDGGVKVKHNAGSGLVFSICASSSFFSEPANAKLTDITITRSTAVESSAKDARAFTMYQLECNTCCNCYMYTILVAINSGL